MSKSDDDVPELVPSSDEETVGTPDLPSVSNGDSVAMWLKRKSEEIEKAQKMIGQMIVGPMYFGFDNCVEKHWISALHSAQLLTRNREKDVQAFTQKEEEIFKKVETTVEILKPEMRKTCALRCALDVVDAVERKFNDQKDVKSIDVDGAIGIGNSFQRYEEMMKIVSSKVQFRGKEEFCVIYIFKNYHRHVVSCSRDYERIEQIIRSQWTTKNDDESDVYKEKGNEAFKCDKFDEAIKYYTKAIQSDRLNHLYYGNRAMTYLKMNKFRESFCDARRSIILDPGWSKGYYRCCEAALELKQFDIARNYNQLGRTMCPKDANFKCLCEQEERIKLLLKETTGPTKSVPDNKRRPSTPVLSKRRPSTPVLLNSTIVASFNVTDDTDDLPSLVSDNDSGDNKSQNVKAVKKSKKQKKKKNKEKEKEGTPVDGPEIEFKVSLREGSEAYLENRFTMAVDRYQQALDMIQHQPTMIQIEEMEIVIIKYSSGMASLGVGVLKSIKAALSKFQSIYETHINIRFPPLYYGLAKCYVDLFRFSEAIDPCKTGLKLVKSGVRCGRLLWPGVDQVIPHADNDILEKSLKELLSRSIFPPQPDAVCRLHEINQEEKRSAIYFSDLDFKGYVRLECFSSCRIEFHHYCWKVFKSVYSITNDKEMINTRCPTPDCWSFVCTITVFKNNPLLENARTVKSDMPPVTIQQHKPIVRMQPSAATVAKRLARKELRKQRKRDAKFDDKENSHSPGARPKEQTNRYENYAPVQQLRETNITINKKDTETTDDKHKFKSKPSKSKKKDKKKSSTVLNLEVNFTDRKEDTLEGTHTDFELTEKIKSEASTVPFNNTPVDDSVSQNLFSYFAEFLEAHGPLHVQDRLLLNEISHFPPEAMEVIQKVGGLRHFLQQSLKFAMINDFVCVLKDAVRATVMSQFKQNRNNNSVGKQVGTMDAQSSLPPVQTNIVSHSASSLDDITLPSGVVTHKLDREPVSHSASSLDDITLPPSVVTHKLDREPVTPLPKPTKLRSAVFDSEENEVSSGTSKQDTEVNVWRERMEKRKVNKTKREVKPADEQLVNDLLKFQTVNGDGKKNLRKKKEYNTLDDFNIPVNSTCSPVKSFNKLDDIDDFDITPSNYKSSVNDYDDMDDTSSIDGYKPRTRDHIHSGSSSVSDISELSDISAGMLYRTSSPSSISSKSTNSIPPHVQKTCKDIPVNPVLGSISVIASKTQNNISDKTSNNLTGEPNSVSANILDVNIDNNLRTLEITNDSIQTKETTNIFPSFYNEQKLFERSTPESDHSVDKSPSSSSDTSPPKPHSSTVLDIPSINHLFPKIDLTVPPPIIPPNPFLSTQQYSKENTDSGVSSQHSLWSTCNSGTSSVFNSPLQSNVEANWPNPKPTDVSTNTSGGAFAKSLQIPPTRAPFNPFSIAPSLRGNLQGFPYMPSNVPYSFSPTSFPPDSQFHTLNRNNSAPIEGNQTTFPQPSARANEKRDITSCDAEIQTVVFTTDVAVNTELNVGKLIYENEQLYKEICRLKQQEKNIKIEYESNRVTMQEKTTSLITDKETLNKAIADSSTLIEGLINTLSCKDQELEEIKQKHISDLQDLRTTREELEQYKLSNQQLSERWRTINSIDLQRAKTAELKVLNVQLEMMEKSFTQVKKEASFHVEHLTRLVQKSLDDKTTIQPQASHALKHWQNILEMTDVKITELRKEFESQIKQIGEGKKLSELPPISYSPPPLPVMQNMVPSQGFNRMRNQNNSPSGPDNPGIAARGQTQPPYMLPQVGLQTGSHITFVQQTPLNRPPPPGMTSIRPSLVGVAGTRFPEPPSPVSSAPKTSMDKLIATLNKTFPTHNKSDFRQMIHELRIVRGGSLSGLSLESIVHFVIEKLTKQNNQVQQSKEPPGFTTNKGLSTPGLELFREDEDPCAICHDDLSLQPVRILECKHSFHELCIRQWFNEQTTCPNCRVHTLLPDEFPSLK
ncbi:uncharacterized protein LOC126829704 [Patella vulgata]|uniref:uncharacterized protein LOC126829704 n=1 Tax=Patella vulgata TaxID=6465 RepID=UPI0021807564|nr:uncharacterized protein LOC126829704 [Patella vulgata]